MKFYRLKALVFKDLAEFRKSKYILSAMIGMPLLFAIITPLTSLYPIAKLSPEEFNSTSSETPPAFFNNLEKTIPNWNNFDAQTQTLIFMAYSMLLVVLLLPAILPAVTASESIVGEKERKTMEAILVSPLETKEIVLAKIISSMLPSFVVTIITAVLYFIIVDSLAYPFIDRLLFPDTLSTLFLFIFTPLISIASVELMILVSTKVSTTRDAYQFGSLVVLPLIVLIIGQVALMFFVSISTLIFGMILMIILDYIFYLLALQIFDREKAIAKLT